MCNLSEMKTYFNEIISNFNQLNVHKALFTNDAMG